MFIHVKIGVTGVSSWVDVNHTREEALTQYACPFVLREITLRGKRVFNMASYGSLAFWATEQPVDSNWPVKKSDSSGKPYDSWRYEGMLAEELEKTAKDITEEIYKEALLLIERGKYQETRRGLTEREKGRYCFFVCPSENKDVDHNYEFIIKPMVGQFQFKIERADRISHTKAITDVIIAAISRSRFVIADLTEERPNCYYEVGFAHAMGKPVIILAKEGTPRHFDISTYKWTFWIDYKDLKPKLEAELNGVFRDLGITAEESL